MNGAQSERAPAQLRDVRAQFQSDPALAARVVAESGTAERHLPAVKAGEFLRMDIKPREMLLGPILPVQGLVMLHAKRGVGKTHLALGIAVAVASGKPFLRWETPKPRKVLFVDGELPASVLQQWIADLRLQGTRRRRRFSPKAAMRLR